jgi:hypothetical protein
MKLKDKMKEMGKVQRRITLEKESLLKISDGMDVQYEKLGNTILDSIQTYRKGIGVFIDVHCESYYNDAGILKIMVEKYQAGQHRYYSLEILISFHEHGLTNIYLTNIKDGTKLGEITNLVAEVEQVVMNYELLKL